MTLTNERKLEIAKETLKGLEEDSYRVSLREGNTRKEYYDGLISKVKTEITSLEKAVGKDK